jgi:hypothetical protein
MSVSSTVDAATAEIADRPVSAGSDCSSLRSVFSSTSFGEARRRAFGAKATASYVVA